MVERYLIVFDDGIPYDVEVLGDDNLINELKGFYEKHKPLEDWANCDAFVYRENDKGIKDLIGMSRDWEDITESQFINEIIGDILNIDEDAEGEPTK